MIKVEEYFEKNEYMPMGTKLLFKDGYSYESLYVLCFVCNYGKIGYSLMNVDSGWSRSGMEFVDLDCANTGNSGGSISIIKKLILEVQRENFYVLENCEIKFLEKRIKEEKNIKNRFEIMDLE